MQVLGVQLDKAMGIVLSLLAAIYLAVNLGWLSDLGSMFGTYLVLPVLWVMVILVICFQPGQAPLARYAARGTIVQAGLLIGFVQVLLYVVGGLFSGFGNSPSSFTALGILRNLFLVSATLVGTEFSRAWLVGRLGKKHPLFAIGFVTLTYTVLAMPLTQLTGIRPSVQTVGFLNSELIPTLAENLLASLLALLAGPMASIAYRGVLEAFWWFCPVLPDLSWALKGLIGTGVPLLGVAFMQGSYALSRRVRRRRDKETSAGGWITIAVFSVAIIWFVVGLFPIRPSLVGSGSMSPAMNVGDVVILAKVPAQQLEIGDVIQFKQSKGVTLIHRVVEIEEGGGSRSFVTKGDANDAPDTDRVIPENIIGKVVFTARKVGWPAVAIKNFFFR